MSNSITASTQSPFSGLLMEDANYNVVGTFPAATSGTTYTPSVYFPNVNYPVVGSFVVQLYNSALTNTSSSVTSYAGLQESGDGVNWNNIAVFTSSLLTFTDNGGSAPAGYVQVLLTPNAKPYLRAFATVPATGATAGGITGSYGINVLF